MHRILARPLASRVAAPAAAAAAKMTSVSGDTAATFHVRRCHTAPPPPPPTEEDEAIAATTIRDAASASSKPDDITSHFLASFLADISGDGVAKPSPEERAVRAAKPQAPAAAEVAESEPEVKPVASTKKSTKPKSRKQSPKEQVPTTTTAVSSVAVAASAAMSSTAKLVHDMASAAKARVVPTVEIGEAPLRFEPTTPTPPVVADESTATVTDPSDVGVFIVDVSVKVPNALGLDYDPAGFAISVLNTGAASVESGYPRTVNFAHGIRDAKAIERLRRILYPDAAEPKKLAAGITVDPKTGKAKGGHEIVLVPSATTHVVVLRSVLNRAAAGKYSVLPLWRLPPPPTADLSVALEDLNDVVLISSALAQACTAKSVHETVSDIVARSRATGTPLDCVSVKPPQRLINYTEIDKSLDEGHFNAQCNSILASPLAEQPTVSEVKDQFKRELVANSKMEASKQPIGAASKSEPTTSASALKKVASAKPPRNGADWLGGLNFDAELARVVGAEKKIVRAPVPKTSKRLGRIAKALKKSGASSRVTAAAAAAKKTKKKKAPALIKMGKRMTAKGSRVAKQKRVQGAPGSAKKKIIVVIPKKSKKAAVSAPKKKKAAATAVTPSKKLLAAAKSAKKPLPKPPVSAKIASAVAKKAPAARKSSPPVKASPLRSTSPSAGSKKGVAAPTKKPTNTKKSTASATKTKAPPKKPSMKPSKK